MKARRNFAQRRNGMRNGGITGEKILAEVFRKALELNSTEIEIEYKDGYEEIFACRDNFGGGIGELKSDSEEAEMLRSFLYGAKRATTFVDGSDKFQFSVRIEEDFGEDTFHIQFKKVI
jgi:hypothetical protein